MATTEKKYLSLEGLQNYDAKIKALIDEKDAATLQAANEHAESLADNYDAAGTATTKVQELADGQVKTNTEAIAAINNETTGILAQAKAYADGKDAAITAAQEAADAAQEAADAAQDTVDNLISGDVATMKGQIESLIAGTYDDSEVRELIQDNADDIATLEGRADDLEGQVNTLVGDDANKSVRTIANEELAKQLIPENANEARDTLEEIAAWIQSHPDDAAALNKALEDLEALVGTLPEGVTATTVVGYIQEVIAAEKSRAEGVESALEDRMTTAEGDIDAIEVSLAEGGATANAIADAKKAGTDAQNMVTALEEGEVADLRADVDELMSVNFVEITTEEIDAMFAA